MAVALMSTKMDPDSALLRPSATVKLVRLIGPIPPNGVINSVKILCKPQPEVHSTSPYGLKAKAECAVEDHNNDLIPFTSYSLGPNTVPAFVPPYTLGNPSPHHSFASNDSTSFCDDPSPVPLSTSPASCDDLLAPDVDMPDPIGELMKLDFPEFDCSDLLCDDQFWDMPDLKSHDMAQSHMPAFADDSSSICCESVYSGYPCKVSDSRGDRQAKKRSSNRQAALRYRERKRLKKQGFENMLDGVRREHDCLRAQLMAEYQSAALLIELAKGMI